MFILLLTLSLLHLLNICFMARDNLDFPNNQFEKDFYNYSINQMKDGRRSHTNYCLILEEKFIKTYQGF